MVAAATASHGYMTLEELLIELLHLNLVVKLMNMIGFEQMLRLVKCCIRGQ